MPQGYFQLAHLPLPAQGNQPGRQHHSSFSGCWPGWAVPAPATTETATHRNTGARCYRMQRGFLGGGKRFFAFLF
jgi:hypothetical protein